MSIAKIGVMRGERPPKREHSLAGINFWFVKKSSTPRPNEIKTKPIPLSRPRRIFCQAQASLRGRIFAFAARYRNLPIQQ